MDGVIQHSFALQLSDACRPFRGKDNFARVAERFSFGEFEAQPVGRLVRLPHNGYADHSPLANDGLTTLESFGATYVGPGLPGRMPLPPTLGWAGRSGIGAQADRFAEPKLIFADRYDNERSPSLNDFLVGKEADPKQREPISQTLLEVMAHRRSRLFGFRLANRFVNVMLPHAILSRKDTTGRADKASSWFMQPLVSFIRGGHDRSRLRSTYSLAVFLIPVDAAGKIITSRRSTREEIAEMVNAGWGFAASPRCRLVPSFEVSGSLLDYLTSLSRFDLHSSSLTLRQAVEKVAFGVGLSLAQGSAGSAKKRTMQLIGNDVVMALGSARVSSVVVVDPELTANEVRRPTPYRYLPEGLGLLMKDLSDPARIERRGNAKGHEFRLDRPFVDADGYAIGLLPIKRCLVVTSRSSAQFGVKESALMQAGSAAYMTIGAATAIGMMRQIDRRLERSERASDPKEIAEIDAEIASDLGEIYDLDITRESYRETYRLFRDRLGITRDYETLQSKMEALYRATSTFHEGKAERLLVWLTAAIVILSVFILIGTIVVAGNGG